MQDAQICKFFSQDNLFSIHVEIQKTQEFRDSLNLCNDDASYGQKIVNEIVAEALAPSSPGAAAPVISIPENTNECFRRETSLISPE